MHQRLRLSPAQFMLCIQVLRTDCVEDVVQAFVEYQVQKQGSIRAAARALGLAPRTVQRRTSSPRNWTPPAKQKPTQ